MKTDDVCDPKETHPEEAHGGPARDRAAVAAESDHIYDTAIAGYALHIKISRAFWALEAHRGA